MAETAKRVITLEPLTETDTEITALVEELCSYANEMGIELDCSDAELCVRHLLLVNQVNKYMNLTRIQDIHEALILHVLDSLALTRELPIEPERFLDLGTGAGFPGIPFSIYTGCEGVLLDSIGKKINAVNAFARELGIDTVTGVHDRFESFAIAEPASFDLVFARAVGLTNLIIEYATPFLEEDGYLLVAKANPSDDEFRLAQKTADICGLELVGHDEFDLPKQLGHRTVYLFQRVSKPKVKLPRPVGIAKKQPLAH